MRLLNLITYKYLFCSTFLLLASFGGLAANTVKSGILTRCETALKAGYYSKALITCNQSLSESKHSQNKLDTVFLYLYLVDVYHALGDLENEKLFLKKAANHPSYKASPKANYLWNRKMGQNYYFLKKSQQAKKYLYQGLTIAQNNNNEIWMAKSYNDIGLIESQLNEYKKSLIAYKESLVLKLKQEDLYLIGTTLNNIGLVYSKVENFRESLSYYEQSLEAFLKYSEQTSFDHRVLNNITHLYEDLAIAYSKINDTEKQSYYQKKTMEGITSEKSGRQRTRALINIVKLQIDKKELESATMFLDKASLLQDQFQFNLKEEIDIQLARLNFARGNYNKTIAIANSILIVAKQKNDLRLLANVYSLLANSYEHDDLKTAYYYLELFIQTREMYLAKKFDSELKMAQFEIEKKQFQHDLMQQEFENIEVRSKNQTLTNWTLSFVIILLLSIGFMFFYRFKKNKEKQILVQGIHFHKQQLMLLNDKYQNLNASIQVPNSSDEESNSNKLILRETLVGTMLEAVDIWESHTGKNRVELAEKSKLWTVSIDGGTLRTRSLDKYLSLEKIPLNPRWRNVAGTCHYILSDEKLSIENRHRLGQRLETLMKIVKAISLETDLLIG